MRDSEFFSTLRQFGLWRVTKQIFCQNIRQFGAAKRRDRKNLAWQPPIFRQTLTWRVTNTLNSSFFRPAWRVTDELIEMVQYLQFRWKTLLFTLVNLPLLHLSTVMSVTTSEGAVKDLWSPQKKRMKSQLLITITSTIIREVRMRLFHDIIVRSSHFRTENKPLSAQRSRTFYSLSTDPEQKVYKPERLISESSNISVQPLRPRDDVGSIRCTFRSRFSSIWVVYGQ